MQKLQSGKQRHQRLRAICEFLSADPPDPGKSSVRNQRKILLSARQRRRLQKTLQPAGERTLPRRHRQQQGGSAPEKTGQERSQTHSLQRQITFITGKDFIRNHPESYVALYVATTLDVARYGRNEAQTIAALIPESVKASPKGQAAVKALLECPMYKGDQLPDFDVYNTNLQIVKLSSLLKEGHYMLVELWASWCGPCRADIPHLKETYERYHGKGFEMVSISVDDDTSAWLKAVQEEGMPWTQACGVNGKGYDKECLNLFGVRGVPSCVLIDGNGKVLSTSCRGGWLNKTLATLYQE